SGHHCHILFCLLVPKSDYKQIVVRVLEPLHLQVVEAQSLEGLREELPPHVDGPGVVEAAREKKVQKRDRGVEAIPENVVTFLKGAEKLLKHLDGLRCGWVHVWVVGCVCSAIGKEVADIPGVAGAQPKGFYMILGWFRGVELPVLPTPLEPDHHLVDRQILGGVVGLLEREHQALQERLDLGLLHQRAGGVVDCLEPTARHGLAKPGGVPVGFLAPETLDAVPWVESHCK
ncbi:hypothetical protein EGW08_001151, partial [Elysia chlorotica]